MHRPSGGLAYITIAQNQQSDASYKRPLFLPCQMYRLGTQYMNFMKRKSLKNDGKQRKSHENSAD